jgi:hypothetical protein
LHARIGTPSVQSAIDGIYFVFVFGLSRTCVSAEAAAVRCAGVDLGSRSTFDAAVAAFGDVRSLFAICYLLVSG